jgi:diguanylate cyclase (GGDEF)-like protein
MPRRDWSTPSNPLLGATDVKDLSESRILIVDDVKTNIDILVEALRDEYKLSVALDGAAALHSIEKNPPDLVLLDIVMPGLDGYEVCRQLKSNPLTSRIPVIFLTAKSTFEDKIHGLEMYADDYLTKPWAQNELLFRVRNQLKTRRGQLQSNALTGLPGNVLIETELSRRISQGEKFAYLHIDLDYFKAYNDYYGHARGDGVIRFVASTLQTQIQENGLPGDFVGHIGGDDFVVITTPERASTIADAIRSSFDSGISSQYDDQDLKRGHIMVLSSRQGGVKEFEIMSITILIVSNVGREISHGAQVVDISKELKKQGKAMRGSVVVSDRRSDGTPIVPVSDGNVSPESS